jgi:hypothetical protein
VAWPASEVIEQIAPHVPEALVAPAALERIKRLGAQIPTGWSSYYIECRLGAGADQVDLLAGVGVADGGVLQRALSSALESPTLTHRPSWRRFANLCRAWRDRGSEVEAQVPALWVELDHAEVADEAGVAPSFCVCVARDYLCPTALAPDSESARSALERSLQLLLPEGADADARARLDRVVEAGAACGRVIHLSVMLGRAPAAIKIYLAVARSQLIRLGEALQAASTFRNLADLTRDLAPGLETVYLDLTMSSPLDVRIGVAFSQFHLRESPRSVSTCPTWDPLLDRAEQLGLCCPEKRAALAGWPGRAAVRFDGEAWPVHLHRYLDLKIVVERGQPTSAKAYLGFMPRATFL